jgi:hypothetical protein
MKPHRLFGLCVLCLSLAAPVAAADVSTKAPKVTVDGSAAVTTDLSKDQWDDWDEGFDDEWVDRRDRDGDRDRDRFDDDDFYNGVDDRQGRDRDDVYDDYGDNWDDRYGRDDDDRYYRDRDRYDNDRDSRLRVCRNGDCNYDRDDDYYDRDSQVRVCRNGVCTYEEERDDYYYDRRSGDRNFEYRLEDNTSDDALPFILQILQQL